MKNSKIITGMLGLILLMFLIGCSPDNVDTGTTGTFTGNATTTSTPAAMLVSAQTNSLTSGNGTPVTAYVVDNIGQPVENATVRFSMDSPLKGQLSQSSALTDQFGNATITFTAGNTDTTAKITGAIGSISSYTNIVIGGGESTTNGVITVVAQPSSIVTGQTSTISATLTNLQGVAAPAGISVTFTLSNGAATLSSYTALTLSNGVATVVVTGSVVSTTSSVNVTASATNYTSGFASVSVSPNNIDAIALTASASSIVTYSTTTITVTVSGPNFIASNNYTINLSLNSSIATLPATFVTTTNNTAQIVLTSLASTGAVIVTATSVSPAAQNQITVNITSPPPDNVSVSANPNPITVNGTTTITALVTANSNSVTNGTVVNFLIDDITLGTLAASTASTVNGVATTTFTASNKAGTATITASAGGGVASDTTTLNIDPAAVGSIQFVSATPQLIGIRTATSTPSSVIKFLINDVTGKPIMGAPVNFTLNGPGGNEYIGTNDSTPTTDTQSTAADGTVSVILQSGFVAGPVTITASVTVGTTTLSTSATQVSIGGGIPSAAHWNLATSQFNLAGLKYSGLQATISAYIGDRFGNYNIPNNTTISFYTEGGAIGTQGITDASGFTSVTLRTQAPNPVNVAKGTIVSTEPWRFVSAQTATYNPRDGWVTVLATAQGEEAFLDENGDGLFSAGTPSTSACPLGYTCECSGGPSVTNGGTCIGSRSEPFSDLSEPFYDKNDDGCRNDGAYKYCTGAPAAASTDPYEQFINTNPGTGVGQNYTFDLPNGKWDGPDCTTTACQKSKMIWKDITLVFTGDYYFWPKPDGNYCYSTTAETGGACLATYATGSQFAEAPASITKGSAGYFSIIIGDAFLNSLPGGTTITASASEGTVTPSSITLLDELSTGPTEFGFVVDIPENSSKSVTTVSVSVDGGPPALKTVNLITPPPAAPAMNAPAAGALAGQIDLSWSAVAGATSYNVYMHTSTGVTKTTFTTRTMGVSSASYTYTGLTTGNTYYFVVTAVGPGGESAISSEVSAMAP